MEFVIKGTYKSPKGDVLIIENPESQTRENLSKYWIGKKVNGHTVKAVESHCIPFIKKGDPIGLLI